MHFVIVTIIVINSHRYTEVDGILLTINVVSWFVHVCAFFATPLQAFERFLKTNATRNFQQTPVYGSVV